MLHVVIVIPQSDKLVEKWANLANFTIFPSNGEKIQWPTSCFENVADFCHFVTWLNWDTFCPYMCLLDQSGVTGGGLDPYNHYNTCFVCKHRQHVDGKIWKSTTVLLYVVKQNFLVYMVIHGIKNGCLWNNYWAWNNLHNLSWSWEVDIAKEWVAASTEKWGSVEPEQILVKI